MILGVFDSWIDVVSLFLFLVAISFIAGMIDATWEERKRKKKMRELEEFRKKYSSCEEG